MFDSSKAGLRAFGWKEVSELETEHAKGTYASIRLAYRKGESWLPIEQRHLCAAKIQPLDHYTIAWNESKILSALVHDNIVSFYGIFTVEPNPKLRDHDLHMERSQVWILLEYANAGDMRDEMARYEGKRVPEPGAKCYMMQIASGLSYLHSKFILHCDLHPKNILLKYNPDTSRTCMICDFGSSLILPLNCEPERFQLDVARLCLLAVIMTDNFWRQQDASDDADQVYEIGRQMSKHKMTAAPYTVPELMTLPWFRTPGNLVISPELGADATSGSSTASTSRVRSSQVTDAMNSPTPGLPHATASRDSFGQRIAQRFRNIGRSISRPFTRRSPH